MCNSDCKNCIYEYSCYYNSLPFVDFDNDEDNNDNTLLTDDDIVEFDICEFDNMYPVFNQK